MGKRCAILIGAAALGAAVIAAGASADFRSVHDPRGDAKCFHVLTPGPPLPCSGSAMRNADIVRATAGHEGRWLKHTIRVVGTFKLGRIDINTDSDAACEYVLFAPGSAVRECPSRTATLTGRARVDIHLHSVEISFSKRSIGFPRFYGWSAYATDDSGGGEYAIDLAGPGYIRHQLR